MSQLFASGGQSIGASALASALPMNIQSELSSFRIDRFELLAAQGTLESSLAPQFESINFSALSLLYVQLSLPFMTIGKILNSLIFRLLP